MPYIEGTHLVKFMEADERLRSIPVMMMTREKSIRTGSAAVASGATAFLTKLFTNEQLRNAIRTIVRNNVKA